MSEMRARPQANNRAAQGERAHDVSGVRVAQRTDAAEAEQLKALRNAELHAHLARALDANPDLGMAKSPEANPEVAGCV